MQAERKIQVLEKENSELKEEIEQLKTKCAQFEVLYTNYTTIHWSLPFSHFP